MLGLKFAISGVTVMPVSDQGLARREVSCNPTQDRWIRDAPKTVGKSVVRRRFDEGRVSGDGVE